MSVWIECDNVHKRAVKNLKMLVKNKLCTDLRMFVNM